MLKKTSSFSLSLSLSFADLLRSPRHLAGIEDEARLGIVRLNSGCPRWIREFFFSFFFLKKKGNETTLTVCGFMV
jgi:hypothetical protein